MMEVTGRPDGPGLVCPVPLAAAADGALSALRAIVPGAQLPQSGAALLGERSRLLGLRRQGRISANGSCRLISCSDRMIALNLPRASDWELLPALFGETSDDWNALEQLACRWDAPALVAQGRQLGLAIADSCATAPPLAPFYIEQLGAKARRTHAAPLVLDLSSLWAGPLAGSLLRMAGARVIKVESRSRPDGARGGNPRFFDLLNAGKESVALDFRDPEELQHLRALASRADMVIESSRPRALRQLGILAEEQAARGAVWVSITGHGRSGLCAEYVGFGDDCAIAGGLGSAMTAAWGEPLFAGDAIADPLTGITAALAAWASWLNGGGQLISLTLADVVAHARSLAVADADEVQTWQSLAENDNAPFYPLREPTGVARSLGADTNSVLH